MLVRLNSAVKILNRNGLSVMVNLANGGWTRLRSDLCHQFLREIDLMTPLEDIPYKFGEKDKAILKKLLPKLEETKFLLPLDSESEIEQTNGFCSHHSSLSLLVTLRCNLNCRHCSANAGPQPALVDPPIKDLFLILEKIIAFDPKSFAITGGEPFFRPDILKLLRWVRNKYTGELLVATNATLITKEMAKTIKEEGLIDFFDVSLDGVDETSCANLRGHGTFERTIRGIKYLQDEGITNISTSMVVTRQNYHLQPAFASLNQELGTKYIFHNFSPAGRGKVNSDEFDMPVRETVQPVAQKIKQEVMAQNSMDIEGYKRWARSNSRAALVAKMQCGAGVSTFTVMPNGDVFPCTVLNYPQFLMGNLLSIDTFTTIIDRPTNRQLTESFHIDHRPGCCDCDVRYFCIAVCMGENYERTGDHLAIHPECSGIQQDLSELVWK